MGIYTAPNMSFLDTYMNAAKEADSKRQANSKMMLEGIGNLAKGGVDAYKWQQRKNDIDKMNKLQEEYDQLIAERNSILNDDGGAFGRSHLNAILSGLDYGLMPHTMKDGGVI